MRSCCSMQTLSLSQESLPGEGALPRYYFICLCEAWSSGKSSIKYIKYINSRGILQQDLETDKIITGRGISTAWKHLEDLGWEAAPPALGEGDLVGMPVQDTAASCSWSLFRFCPGTGIREQQEHTWCRTPCTGQVTTKTHGHHQNPWSPHLQGEVEHCLQLLEEGGKGEGRNHLPFQKIPASQRQEPA